MKKTMIAMAVVSGSLTASTYYLTLGDKNKQNYNVTEVRNWLPSPSQFTEWVNIGTEYDHSDFLPLINNQTETFIQTQTSKQNQERYEQKREYDDIKDDYKDVGEPIKHEQTITKSIEREVEVVDFGWNDIGDVLNCSEWNPAVETVLYDEEFTQSRNCEQERTKNVEYYIETVFQSDNTINEFYNITEEQQAFGRGLEENWVTIESIYTEWIDIGEGFDHLDWQPIIEDQLADFVQNRDFSQTQERQEQKMQRNISTLEEKPLGSPLTEEQDITKNEERTITVNILEFTDIRDPYDCEEWLPHTDTILQGESFIQTAQCNQDQEAIVEYSYESNILETGLTESTRPIEITQEVTGTYSSRSVTINPSIDVNETESDFIENIPVTLSEPSNVITRVNYNLSANTAGVNDFTGSNGTLVFNVGETEKFIPINIKGDDIDEYNETFKITLTEPYYLNIDNDISIITIIDNDDEPTLSINNKTITETDTDQIVNLKVTLSTPSEKTVTVDYTTSSGSASSDDYVSDSGKLTFNAGETEKFISVTINGDDIYEDTENFSVRLSNAEEATITNNSGNITINNDDVEYEFNTLPIYGKVEYFNGNSWETVSSNTEYGKGSLFRYNPEEDDVKAVSKDINVGNFDTDPSTPNSMEGTHSINDWGNVSGSNATYSQNGVIITTSLSHGSIMFNEHGGNFGLGSSSGPSDPSKNYYEISAPMFFTINLDGDFLNDVQITAGLIGGCFDLGSTCETKVAVDAYDYSGNLISSQGGYRQSGIQVDSYYFTGDTPIKYFKVYPVPTNEGGNNPNLSSGNFILSNMTVSRSAFEVITYQYKDTNGNTTTETINLNINEGNANVNVDLNSKLLK